MSRTTNLNNKPPLGTLIGKRLKEIGKQQKWLEAIKNLSLCRHQRSCYPDIGCSQTDCKAAWP